MPVIRMLRENKTITAAEGEILLQAIREAGIRIETPCNGAGICGKCRVKVSDLSAVQLKQPVCSDAEEEENRKLVPACQTRVLGDLEVDTLETNRTVRTSILSSGEVRSAAVSLPLLKELSPSDYPKGIFGLTVDIGTTTLVCALIDLYSGEEIAAETALNPQCLYAQDVVSRIRYTIDQPEGLKTLFEAVSGEINRMMLLLTKKQGISPEMIVAAVYAGNTTMLHLALNSDPASLGKYPYTPVITGGYEIPAAEAGLLISDKAGLYIPPIISSYVGADITAGIIAVSPEKYKGTTLFIDIGTNGEMILASDGVLTATSTAAGPAFEGMNITFGMRASDGALEYYDLDSEWNETIRTIGDRPVSGICGSGLFDLTGELVRNGVIDKKGRMAKADTDGIPEKIRINLKKYKGKASYALPNEVYLTQLDIRQIQLAKSAIRSGIEAMLEIHALKPEQVDQVLIAGSFGYHLRTKSLINMGILPEEFAGRIRFVGNTAKTGATAMLINEDLRKEAEHLVKNIRTLELSEYPGFEKIFIKQMNF